MELFFGTAVADPFDNAGGVLGVVIGEGAFDDGAAGFGEFQDARDLFGVGVGLEGVQADGFAEGEFGGQITFARADGTSVGEKAELLGDGTDAGCGVEFAGHGAIEVAEFEGVSDTLGTIEVGLDEESEGGFSSA